MPADIVNRVLNPKIADSLLEMQLEGANPICIVIAVLDADGTADIGGFSNSDYPQAGIYQAEMIELVHLAWGGKAGDAKTGLLTTLNDLTSALRRLLADTYRGDLDCIVDVLASHPEICRTHAAALNTDGHCPTGAARALIAQLPGGTTTP